MDEIGGMMMKLASKLHRAALLLAFAWPAAHGLAADADAGKNIYTKQCAGCHGADGKGNPAMIKALGEKGLNITSKEVKAMKDEQITKIIVEGAGKMPAAKSLSPQEQKEVVRFVRSLAK